MRLIFLCAFLLLAVSVKAQQASIKKVEIDGDKIIVHYDLEDPNAANEYQIGLYASQNNFATALTKVQGDVGPMVKPGPGKKIEWNIVEELGPYAGKLALEIRGRMYVPVARFNNLETGDSFRRGKTHLITWRPGNNNAVNIELLKGDQPVRSQLNQSNDGSFSFYIPPHTAVGKDYSLRITDTRDPDNVTRSQTFAVRRKIPLVVKALPILVVGGVVAVLMGDRDGGGEGGGGGGHEDGAIKLPEFPN